MYTELQERDIIKSRLGVTAWVIGVRDSKAKRNLVVSFTNLVTGKSKVQLMSLAECQRSFPFKVNNA